MVRLHWSGSDTEFGGTLQIRSMIIPVEMSYRGKFANTALTKPAIGTLAQG